ncbi:PEP-CTERM sorting domain-containing protein [Haloferula sp. BvORR071]|uniref:PEP-CTERM sorting domain-containing protein n=1 Tax=Haloferula sp. BvORR071 TaxID=1396141 RepID=UPI0005511661|nr:PEP-CTERM sorting domain-containing protein [Haloferula sp. BvORR071]
MTKQSSFKPLSLLLASIAGLASSGAAVLTNGGFESGTSGWTASGSFTTVSSLDGEYAAVSPTAGTSFGVVSNNGVTQASASQTFDISAAYLLFDYRFLTDEYNTGTAYNDSASVILTIGGNPTTLLTVSRNDLQSGGQGSLLAGAGFLDNTQFGFDIGQNAWKTFLFDTSAFIGQSATLSFQVNNVGDSTPDIGVSQLAVDRIQQVPEPTAPALLLSALGLTALRRRRR